MSNKLLKFVIYSIAAAAGAYCLVQNRQLRVEECRLVSERLPQQFEGKKILLIADLHKKRYGENFNNLMNSVLAAEPDYIFFSGDLYSKDETDLLPKAALMKRLKEAAPVYYVLGNHEIRNMDNCEALCYKLESMGINVLRNDMMRIYENGAYINVYGTQLPISCYINRKGRYSNLKEITADDLDRYLGKARENEFNMLISHNPFFLEAYAEWGADMVFAGHCHGGCVRLPFVGGILSPERKFFPKYTKGIYRCGKTVMALTAGLGKFRLNNPSEVMLCTLSREEVPKKHSRNAWTIDG